MLEAVERQVENPFQNFSADAEGTRNGSLLMSALVGGPVLLSPFVDTDAA